MPRAVHAIFNSNPIPHIGDFAEGDGRLHHAEWAGIHSEKHHRFPSCREASQILLVGPPRIGKRVVDVCDRGRKSHRIEVFRELPGGLDDGLANS